MTLMLVKVEVKTIMNRFLVNLKIKDYDYFFLVCLTHAWFFYICLMTLSAG